MAQQPQTQSQPQKPAAAPKLVVPVRCNRESMVQLQLPSEANAQGQIMPGARIDLKPGLNFVAQEWWIKAKENPTVQILLNTEIPPSKSPEQNPERVGQPYLEEAGQAVEHDYPLKAMSEDDAVIATKELFDAKQLKGWLTKEHRGRVAGALKQQIAILEKTVEKKAG